MRHRSLSVYIHGGLSVSLILLFSLTILLTNATTSRAATGHTYVKSGDGKQKQVATFVTWYGFNDNSGETEDQHGSAAIAYPKSDSQPTLHDHATEGSGTYDDPITFAAPPKNQDIFPIGSIVYVPFVQKYFIMEDDCGDTDPQGCAHYPHADLWMGPNTASDDQSLTDCEDHATPDDSVPIIINPGNNFVVDTSSMFHNNTCTIHLHDNTPQTTDESNTASPTTATTPGSGQDNDCTGTSTADPLWSGKVDTDQWQQSLGIDTQAATTLSLDNLSTTADPTGTLQQKVLQVTYPSLNSSPAQGKQIGATYGSQFLSPFSKQGSDCLYLSYYINFPKDFNFANGGVLPGLYGGANIDGSSLPDGTDGFSVRLFWNSAGGGGIKAYLPTGSSLVAPNYAFDGHLTSIGENSWNFAADGQWHHIEMQVALNTNTIDTLPDGSIKVWYDETNVLSVSGAKFRTPGNALSISGLFFSTFFNPLPAQATQTIPAQTHVDFAEFQASSNWLEGDTALNTHNPTYTPQTTPSNPAPGTYDLALKLVPGETSSTKHTYQIQVKNVSGSVTDPLILDFIVQGNQGKLDLTSTTADQGWVIVQNSADAVPRLQATYTGSYPIAAMSDLPVITVTISGTISAGADLFGWVDISGSSGDGDFSNNVVSQGLN